MLVFVLVLVGGAWGVFVGVAAPGVVLVLVLVPVLVPFACEAPGPGAAVPGAPGADAALVAAGTAAVADLADPVADEALGAGVPGDAGVALASAWPASGPDALGPVGGAASAAGACDGVAPPSASQATAPPAPSVRTAPSASHGARLARGNGWSRVPLACVRVPTSAEASGAGAGVGSTRVAASAPGGAGAALRPLFEPGATGAASMPLDDSSLSAIPRCCATSAWKLAAISRADWKRAAG
ncbi:MAG: hypothetical protein IT373_03395, partial [Polyangiaceae bacterium]|nr:hypothetical protein [Polyangiaceae bacterium]